MDEPNRLKELRKKHHLTRERLAQKAGVTLMTIYRLERGENDPHLLTAQAIAKALDVNVEDIWPAKEVAS